MEGLPKATYLQVAYSAYSTVKSVQLKSALLTILPEGFLNFIINF